MIVDDIWNVMAHTDVWQTRVYEAINKFIFEVE
jgi:hypothetical protein